MVERLAEARDRALAAPDPDGAFLRRSVAPATPTTRTRPTPRDDAPRVVEDLNRALHRSMESDERVIVLGEDLFDPYGGAFKATKGLSTRFPDRLWTTPISEAGIMGLANGLALGGRRPVVEFMFGDFLGLATDQILNGTSKLRHMFGGVRELPVVIRTPMGGGRGYGPTHSQSLEGHFLGIPGLTVVALSRAHPCGAMLEHAILRDHSPVLVVENKLLYGAVSLVDEPGEWSIELGPGPYPTAWLSLDDLETADAVIVTYGGLLPAAMEAAHHLAYEEELFVPIVVPSRLDPLPVDDLLAATARSRRLVVVEEGTLAGSVGAEIVAALQERLGEPGLLVRRVGSADVSIPSARSLENVVLPGRDDVLAALRDVLAR